MMPAREQSAARRLRAASSHLRPAPSPAAKGQEPFLDPPDGVVPSRSRSSLPAGAALTPLEEYHFDLNGYASPPPVPSPAP